MKGRDPYAGIVREMRENSRAVQPALWCLGVVLRASPLLIRANGMELDGEDLRINPALLPHTERAVALRIESGSVSGSASGMPFSASLNGGTVSGTYTLPDSPLREGDQVVLLPEEGGLLYFVLCKVVQPS